MYSHVNGDLVAEADASVSVHDRGFRYGDAVHTTLRAYGGTVFAWESQQTRLQRAADRLGFADRMPDLRWRVRETLDANDLADACLDVTVTRGNGTGLIPADATPTVVITAGELPRGGLGGERTWDAPAVVQIVKTRASTTHTPLEAILAHRELERARTEAYNADEALVRDNEDHLVGGAASSVFFVEDGTLKTPRLTEAVVSRATRAVVVALARDETFPVETGRYTPADVRGADEAFLTNARWELRPIARADGVAVGAGPVTRLLAQLFDEHVEQRHYRDS